MLKNNGYQTDEIKDDIKSKYFKVRESVKFYILVEEFSTR